jgi:putative photosynthetic complex assembly protein 2
MMDFVLPPVVAVLVWWLGTGGVMLLDRLPRDSWRYTLGTATTVVAAALVCIARSADNTTTAGAYAGFVCAVVAWGWHELTFLAGWITGPRRSGCSEPSHWPTRLRESVQAILWHEIGILLMLALIAALTWNRANPVALWTFGLLWTMRLSAKLNLFLGVRNWGEQFLPPQLAYLPSYFHRRSLNALLPVVLVVGTAVLAWLFHLAADSQGGQRAALLLVASMGVLAIAEHLLMVLPLQSTALWRWAMRRHAQAMAAR